MQQLAVRAGRADRPDRGRDRRYWPVPARAQRHVQRGAVDQAARRRARADQHVPGRLPGHSQRAVAARQRRDRRRDQGARRGPGPEPHGGEVAGPGALADRPGPLARPAAGAHPRARRGLARCAVVDDRRRGLQPELHDRRRHRHVLTAHQPAPVAALRAQVGAADALAICSPEYAHGMPGSLKNVLDWLVTRRGRPAQQLRPRSPTSSCGHGRK
ncbi:MAG: NAD(P)H-dependent oxidoreductase [Myxococcales bacterium]|nr:NAD(P)H-dependent oxidoreductase [Myxococcales bacterium]